VYNTGRRDQLASLTYNDGTSGKLGFVIGCVVAIGVNILINMYGNIDYHIDRIAK
jgi:hypothetical protein